MRIDVGNSRAGGNTWQAKRCKTDANSAVNFGNIILWVTRQIAFLNGSIAAGIFMQIRVRGFYAPWA